ncbi:MAG TPA: hypothetical protein VGL93_12185 [Streptosporangiaceae bacterium]|jgi:hypothetical protein
MGSAGAWYSSVSWQAVTEWASLLIGLLSFGIAWLNTMVRRKLLYGITMSLFVDDGVLDAVAPERRPYVAGRYLTRLTITVRGTKDVSTRDFDAGRPLVLDVGAPVQDVRSASNPFSLGVPSLTVSGSQVMVGPGLIGRGHVVEYYLAGGPSAGPACVSRPLVDVAVKQESPTRRRPANYVLATVTTLLLGYGVIGPLLRGIGTSGLPGWVTAAIALVIGLVETWAVAWLFLRRPRGFERMGGIDDVRNILG